MKNKLSDLEVDDVFLVNYKYEDQDFDIICAVMETDNIEVDGMPGIKISDLKTFNGEDLDYEYNISLEGYDSGFMGDKKPEITNQFTFKEFLFSHQSVLGRLEEERPEYFV